MFPTLCYCSSASRFGVFQVLLMPGIPEGWLPPEGRKVSWLFPSQGCISMWFRETRKMNSARNSLVSLKVKTDLTWI